MKQLDLIKKQLSKGALPHAYLFSGKNEEKKNEALKFLLKDILGIEDTGILHPDLRVLDSDPISIDDIRAIKTKSADGPLIAKKSFIYIKDIENLSRDAAPALLKLLEEPNLKTFILATTANAGRLMPTLKSRFSHAKFIGGGDAVDEKFILPKKPPEGDDVVLFMRKALRHSESLLKKSPTPSNIERMAKLLKASDALEDPTVNRRLLGEYVFMLL